MIDVEDIIFDRIYRAIIAEYPTASIASEYVRQPEKFPHVSVVEQYNATNVSAASLSKIDNAADLMYEVDVYTNIEPGKKQQAKSIINIINQEFSDMGFIRQTPNIVPNLNDSTIYRVNVRYERVLGNEEEV